MGGLRISHDDVDTLTSDGRIVHIRDIRRDDLPALLNLHDRASDRSIYLRYFSQNRRAARQYVKSIARANDDDHHALGAFAHDQLLGVGVFERVEPDSAEFALFIADEYQHEGIGTLLLEHLIAEARGAGIRRFVAEVLAANAAMIEVVRDLGFPATTDLESGSVHVEFELAVGADVVTTIADRERAAGAASLGPLFSPRSVAVVGAGQRGRTVGHEVLRNLLEAGYTGTVHVVNPHRDEVLGVACVPSPRELPEPVDLAVLAIPAQHVPEAMRELGGRGCRAAVILGAGFGEAGEAGARLQDEVLTIARRFGIRLVGPNCLGVANTDPEVRLDATFALLSRRPGRLAVLAQSGAFGAALLSAADRVGLGVSQFVSVGNKADVGGNDVLPCWEQDRRTRAVAMYLESVGDPRRFQRIARRVSRHKPILAVKSGRTEVGRRAGRSHTAAAATADVVIDALFRSSGVLRMRTMQELLDAARVLTDQPLPAGPRVAIVGNSGGPEILAADAAAEAGLVVNDLDPRIRAQLRELGAPEQNPLDLGAAAAPELVAAVLRVVLGDPTVDAVLTVFTDIAVTDPEALRTAVLEAATETEKTVVSVAVGAAPVTVPMPGTERALPVFAFPEAAAGALGVAYRYATIAASPVELASRPEDVDASAARSVVEAAMRAGGGWLTAGEVHRLLVAYGVPACPQVVVRGVEAALAGAAELGYPLAVKLAAPGLHKTDVGGIRLDIRDEAGLRLAVADLQRAAPEDDRSLLIQPMVPTGTELIIGAVHDPQCGPIVMLGAGGVLTDVLEDRSFALAPLTVTEAEQLIDELRTARLLAGFRGSPPVSRVALCDVLVRVAALVDDVPEIVELDLNPMVCRGEQVLAVDARIRVAEPPDHTDPLVRQLRGPTSRL